MNGYLNWMIALLVLVSSLIACVQTAPEPCSNLPAIAKCAKTCFDEAGSRNGCKPGDVDCQCESFKASVINSLDQACLQKACGIEEGTQAQSDASIVCKCRPTPTRDQEITFPDDTPSDTIEDPPPTTTAEPPATTSEVHHHPHLHRFFHKIPGAGALSHFAKSIFHGHGS